MAPPTVRRCSRKVREGQPIGPSCTLLSWRSFGEGALQAANIVGLRQRAPRPT